MHFLVVDDDFNARGGTALTLKSIRPGCEVHEAGGVQDAIAVLQREQDVELVLLDLNVNDSRGLETLKTIKAWCEEWERTPRLVVVSAGADYDETLIAEAIEECATGFVAKGVSEPVFRSAMEITLAGGIYIPESYLHRRRTTGAIGAGDGLAQINLTGREKQVVELLRFGLSYKEIARRIEQAEPGHEIAPATVRVHVQRVAWKIKTMTGDSRWETLCAKAAVVTYFAATRSK